MDLASLVGTNPDPYWTTEDILLGLNTTLAPYNLQLRPVFAQIKASSITSLLAGGTWDGVTQFWTLTSPGADFTALNVTTDDYLTFFSAESSGLDTFLVEAYWKVTAVAPGGDVSKLTISRKMGTEMGAPTSPHKLRFSVGTLRFLELSPIDAGAAIDSAMEIAIGIAPNPGAAALGFTPGTIARMVPLDTDVLAGDITVKSRFVRADTVVQATGTLYQAYSLAYNPSIVAFSLVPRDYVTFVQLGTSFTATSANQNFEAAGVLPGHYLTLRSGVNSGASYLITAVTGNQITASGTLASPTKATIDVAPVMSTLLAAKTMLVIPAGANAGSYLVKGAGLVPTELRITTALPAYKTGSSPVSFEAQIGTKHLRFRALDATLNCTLKLSGSVSSLLDTRWPMVNAIRGYTSWYLLSAFPKTLTEGSKLSIYATEYNVPSESYTIEETRKALKIMRISGRRANNEPITFADTPPPYAVLLPGNYIEYSVFTGRLGAWLNRTENTGAYASELQRYVNLISTSTVPTSSDINTAQAALLSLYTGLTEEAAATDEQNTEASLDFVLRSFRVPEESSVTALLRACRERGASRASDILLQCRFRDFFDLTAEEASYVGAVQKAVRDVVRNDLPVSKSARTVDERIISISQEGGDPDYELIETEAPLLSPTGEGDLLETPDFFTEEA
jgi:hypothetical protein